jgi:Na+-translocating ferredoxin:NAD+ oxidoreductase subunit E
MNAEVPADGVFARNPAFKLALGACPAIAVTTTVFDALAMGTLTAAVLTASNFTVSLGRNIIPRSVKTLCQILIVTAFASIAAVLLAAFAPKTAATLGIYVPLISINCLILGRAETFASENRPLVSLTDGLVTGAGFIILLLGCGAIRELLGQFSLMRISLLPWRPPFSAFTSPCGGFFAIAFVIGFFNFAVARKAKQKKP